MSWTERRDRCKLEGNRQREVGTTIKVEKERTGDTKKTERIVEE